jgi:hypothetical protein
MFLGASFWHCVAVRCMLVMGLTSGLLFRSKYYFDGIFGAYGNPFHVAYRGAPDGKCGSGFNYFWGHLGELFVALAVCDGTYISRVVPGIVYLTL